MKAERIWRRPNQLRPALPGSKQGGEARFRATARLDRTSFGVTKKGMVGRTVDLVIEAVAQPA
jgi:polyisoprenoid-binding protein YceI